MRSERCERAVRRALKLIQEESPVYDTSTTLTTSASAKDFWRLRLGGLKNEQFEVLLLNNKHEIIACETVAVGSVNSAVVYPRKVVSKVLEHNAVAVIFAHNHPSGETTPSQADRVMTKRLKDACESIDVSVLDHIIVGSECYSFADNGIL